MSKHFKKKYLLALIPVFLAAIYFLKPGTGGIDKISIQQVESGNLDFSISSSGQVTSDQSVDLNPQGNGPVTQILAEEGDEVQRGQLLLSLDTTTQSVNLSNAELDLESAQLQLKILQEPASESDRTQAENDILKAQNDLAQRETTYDLDLKNQEQVVEDYQRDIPGAEEDAFNTVASIFVDLPDTLGDLENLMKEKNYVSGQSDMSYYNNSLQADGIEAQYEKVKSTYALATTGYDTALALYQETSRNDLDKLPDLTQTTYDSVDAFSSAWKEMDIYLAMVFEDFPMTNPNYVVDEQRAVVKDNIAIVNPYLSSIYANLSTLNDLDRNVADAQDELIDISTQYNSDVIELQLSIDEKESALTELQKGASDNDIRKQEIAIEKEQNNLEAAQKAYHDQFIYAPFSGVITNVGVDLGQNASSSTAAFTLVSQEKLIEVNINEIDVSQVQVGKTGTAYFDSFPDESVNIELAFVSEVNESDSSIVEYKAHFTLGANDLNLKEGMSAEVNLVLDQKENVLLIPRLALVEENGQTYVDLATNVGSQKENTLYDRSEFIVTRVPVSIGLSNAENIEVLDGLKAGDWVLLQPSTAVAAPQNQFGRPPESNQATTQ